MSDAVDSVRRLFGIPGSRPDHPDELLEAAAAAHAGLLAGAEAGGDPAVRRSVEPLRTFLRGPATRCEKRRLLCHPLFIEGLHGLAPFAPALARWHDRVTAPPADAPTPSPTPAASASLGPVALSVLLGTDPNWRGSHDLCTDGLGRLAFPTSDWTIALQTDGGERLGGAAVVLILDRDTARWQTAGPNGPTFLETSRADCLRLVVGNHDPCDRHRLKFPDPRVRPRLQCACPLGHGEVRYDPVGFRDFAAHAGLTGGLVERLLAAVQKTSPAIHAEFVTFMHTVRGFEFAPTAAGTVASFSDPTLPGVMSVSAAYSPGDELCVDPCCFTWFGHELGHTKDYLCDTALDAAGGLAFNPADRSGVIPRYGRPLSVRTLVQVPYVHLYELALMTDFRAAGFRGLPWDAPADAAAAGDDLVAEIAESFTLIEEWADLTPTGEAAMRHFAELFTAARARWRGVQRS